MSGNLERFTQRTRRVLSRAQEEAKRLHNTIGTEHMLLGLIREKGGVAERVLRDLGLEQKRVEELVEELTRTMARTTVTTAELSPGTKRVIELGVDEARWMGHHYIGTEHLLLGLVRQSEGVAIDVLKRLGVSPEEVRRQTRRVLQESPVQTNTAPTPPAPVKKSEDEKFTARTQRVLALAQTAAKEWGHNSVGTGHLLMGMLREEDGIAGRVLRELGITPEQVEAVVKESTQTIDSTDTIPELSLDSQRVLQLAVDEGRRMGHHEIGIYHLLLGLTQQSETIDILKRLSVSPEDVRQRTLLVAEKLPASPPTPPADMAFPTGEHAKSFPFQIIENFIAKMLGMVESKSLTLDQAKELLNALQPQLELLAGESALAASQINHAKGDDTRKITLQIKAKESDAPAWEIELPVAQALLTIDDLMVAAANHRAFTTTIEGSQVEVRVRLE